MNVPIKPRRLRTAFPIQSGDLRVGMFVSHVACGWHRTPFMLEGLLLKNNHEINTIISLTMDVTVDPSRSEIAAFDALQLELVYEVIEAFTPRSTFRRSTDIPPANVPRVYQSYPKNIGYFLRGMAEYIEQLFKLNQNNLRDRRRQALEAHPTSVQRDSQQSRRASVDRRQASAGDHERFPRFIEVIYTGESSEAKPVWFQRLRAWLYNASKVNLVPTAKLKKVADSKRPSFLPEDIDLVNYPETESVATAIPEALAAYQMSEKILVKIAEDICNSDAVDMPALQTAADTLAENMISRPATMLLAARMRDENDRIYRHGLGVAVYLTMLGRHLGFQREPLTELATIGLLLDLGKMDLDQTVLDKPGALDDVEHEMMRSHVDRGVENLRSAGVTSPLVLRAIEEHHERVDGLGYPNGLSGDEISIYGKMAAIADSFVAMIGERSYAPTMSTYDALRTLFAEAGTRWHEPLIEQFVQAIGIFPVGSLIELVTGEVAIVVEDNRFRRLEPKILILTDTNKKHLVEPISMDMMKHNFSIAPESVHIMKGLADGSHGVNFREYYLRRK
jgi:HD-GYP domain-containing protein (c-di-GMP phosphodiesterase class II)